jgi:hypothetical protein
MKVPRFPHVLALIGCLAAFAPALAAQTTIQLFNAVDTRASESTASYSTPDTFSTTTLNLTCSTSPIQAILSGPLMNNAGTAPALSATGALQPGGNLLVDNNIIVTVTPAGGSASAPANACLNGIEATGAGLYSQNCWTGSYGSNVSNLIGQDPDTYLLNGQTVDAVGGVPEIDLGTSLAGGLGLIAPGSEQQSVTIALTNEGGDLTSSTIFLQTNCTQGGVTGPATVTGNTISTGNTSSLAQTFNFDTGSGQQVGFVYNLAGVTIFTNNQNNQAIPQTSDVPLNPTAFQPDFVQGTSFATSSCLVHTGELLPSGSAACKLYTLECTIGTGAAATGAQCPVSAVANEVVNDLFDGPAFSLQNIYTTFGPTYHEGIGFLMASEEWGGNNPPNPLPSPAVPDDGGPCVFDTNSGLESLPCPLNLLTSFSGPGSFDGEGETKNPNSTFVSIYGVPEDLTSVSVAGERSDNWVNTNHPQAHFVSQPPNFSHGAFVQNGNKLVSLPGAGNFKPSPIESITYGLAPANSLTPPTPIQEPIASDLTVTNPAAVCSATPLSLNVQPNFAPTPQTLTFDGGTIPDGQYLLHYYAEDCAGTRELLFTQAPGTGSWSTNFYTYPVNVDTTPPVVSSIVLSPSASTEPYALGEKVTASYSCSDATTGSGVVLCGINTYSPESTYETSVLKSQLNTSSKGTKTFTVTAEDGAGNTSSGSVTYTVK